MASWGAGRSLLLEQWLLLESLAQESLDMRSYLKDKQRRKGKGPGRAVGA